MNDQEFQVTLTVPPELEEAVVDCLLMLEAEHGFCSFPINSHNHRNQGLSLAEQVSGRQRKIRFQMYLAQADLETLLSRLKEQFAGSGIIYRVLPVLDGGKI